jgi:hypothetical protein
MTGAIGSRSLAQIFLVAAFGVALVGGPANAQKQAAASRSALSSIFPVSIR